MIGTVTSNAWTALFATSLAFLGTLAWHRPWESRAPLAVAELQSLEAERAQFSGHTDQLRSTLRAQSADLRGRAWTDARLARLRQEFPGWDWKWEPAARPAHAVLSATTSDLETWHRGIEAIRLLSAQPGAIVESLEAEAIGHARQRRFVRIAVGVRFIRVDAAVDDAERAEPSRGPLPVVPADEPGMPRKAGLVISPSLIPARPSGVPAGLSPTHVHNQIPP